MRGLRAALYKDFKLFFRGTGALALVLPFLLLLALRLGMADLSRQAYVQPFPIAVQDLDGTIMSRSLISQIREIELFSQVEVLEEGESPEQALAGGAAAVVTVPKDFFYDLYSMKDCPVDVVLNADMPLESTLFETIFTSVMDIIRADQSAGIGLYRFCYGELTPQLQSQLYRETSEHLLVDALSRQTVFDTHTQLADVQGAMERRLLACVLSMLALFFPLLAVKTLPEELALGVLPRFQGIGGRRVGFVLSKLTVSLLLTLPTLILILLAFPSERPAAVLVLSLVLLAGSFGVLLGLAAWAGNAASVQRWGNLIILLSLVLGGTLWPRHLLPGLLPSLGRLTLPYYAVLGLEAIQRGLSGRELLALLWPVFALGAAGAALAIPGFRRLQGRSGRTEVPASPGSRSLPVSDALSPSPARLAGLSLFKLRVMGGGRAGLAALLAAALLCGGAALSVSRGSASSLRLALVDEDQSNLSQALGEALDTRDGLTLTRCQTPAQGQRMVLLGEVEGLLVIGEGYQEALESSDTLPLSYQQAAASLSAQGAREVIAGQVAVQRSRLRALSQAQDRLERALSQDEQQALLAQIAQAEAEMPPLFHTSSSRGAAPSSPFYPSPLGVSCLAVLLTLLTAAAWSGGSDSRRVEARMASVARGRLLSYGSDCLALTGLGVLTALAILYPSGSSAWGVVSAVGYAFTAAALALAVTRFTAQEGRVDALAPFLALILCLLGGCFLDLSQFSSSFALLSSLTPPGLARMAESGSLLALAALLGEGLLFLFLGKPSAGTGSRPIP